MKFLNGNICAADRNCKVVERKSEIDLVGENSGNGLFAVVDISKREIVCTYGGDLVDSNEAKYMNKCYMVNFENGRGYKLNGNGKRGDKGHSANSVHPNLPLLKSNCRFVKQLGFSFI